LIAEVQVVSEGLRQATPQHLPLTDSSAESFANDLSLSNHSSGIECMYYMKDSTVNLIKDQEGNSFVAVELGN
jgi:hypothetical protein